MNEFIGQVSQWWIVLFLLGIISLPISSSFFSSFFDKGYAFTKSIGIIILSYSILVLGITHLLPFSYPSLLVIIVMLSSISLFIFKKGGGFALIGSSWKIMLFEEILFIVCLSFWCYIKSFQPDIHGLEKFMDYGFVNSILRTTYFPPKDMWMTPLSINYYYFGHLETAILTKLSGLPSYITFNLMLSTLFSLTFIGTFSLGGNLLLTFWKNAHHKIFFRTLIPFALVTAFLLTFGGNLHTLYTFFTPYHNDSPVSPLQLVFSPQTFPNEYWYPNATRFIHNTIHEFPSYSFVVSDLHGHVLDIPQVLLMLGVLLFVFSEEPTTRKLLFETVIMGVLASVLYMTNAWDGLIYIGVAILLIMYKFLTQKKEKRKTIKKIFFFSILLIISFFLGSLPFSLFFKPFASQVGINCAPEFLLRIGHIGPLIFERGFCQTSPLWQLAILYGFFFFWFVSFLLLLLFKKDKQIIHADLFVLGLGVLGFGLIIIPEFVYLKDIYTTYFRANTMFKLVYQSFILLSFVNGYTLYRVFSSIGKNSKQAFQKLLFFGYMTFSVVLISLVIIYPYFAITSYFNNLKTFEGLDGISYLRSLYPDDYNAILWINKHITGQPVLLEAQGDSYTDYERISSNTGLPTVFGWMVHEWLWRGTYSIVPGRVADVKALYESPDLQDTKNLVQQYHVQYVYIGKLEREKYPQMNGEKFEKLGRLIYSSGEVKIYQILL